MLDNPTLLDLTQFTTCLKARHRVTIHLSRREKQVMQLKADGLTLEAIALKLGITVGVVRLYIQSVHKKLNVQCTESAVAKCVKLGVVKVEI